MYWLKTWADWYWDKIIMTTTKDTSVNFVCMTVSVKRYWKTIQEDVSYMGHKESSFQKLMTRRGVTQSSLQKPDTNYVYLLSSTQTLKAFYVNKARASHHYQILHHSIPNHLSCGSCICVKFSDVRYFEAPQVNIGDEITEKFLDQVLAAATISIQHLADKIPMKQLTLEQWRKCNNATNCLICAKPVKSADKKVRDHNHLTGEYRGPAHNACDLNYRIDPKKVKIPCIIDNLKGILFLCYSYFYDYKLLKAIFMILISIATSFVAIL